MTQFQEYLSSDYPGFASFIDRIIKPIFGASFRPDDDLQDMIECPEDIDFNLIAKSTDKNFKTLAAECGVTRLLKLGRIRTSDGFPIHVYDITVVSRKHIARNRKGIQEIIRRNSEMANQTGAFMLFHYEDQSWEWRFSYCFIGKNRYDSTSGKRYTYLLGPGQSCKTAALRFQTLLKKGEKIGIEDITDAFSVESVSKEFFDEYRANYADIVCYVTGKRMVKVGNKWEEKKEHEPNEFIMQQFAQFANPEKSVRDYIKKLMGRLVFLQFIQKKGWLSVPMNDETWSEGDKEFIRHLFDNYAHQDTFIDDVLEPLFYDINTRRKDDRANSILGADIKVPYLNGGLFEKDAEDDTLFPLPAKYMADLLEFFSAYNFTIDENDPDDAEVGIDPEMLGRVFENLLEDNKDKGAFYTPKEIVQYMCRESLIAYLQTDIEDSATKDRMREFVTSHDKSALDASEEFRVDKKLREVKICDPAIGSGAFPMGLLKELFECRMAIEGSEEGITRADIKKDIIQNSIYGVDIEKGAVDIARLRFWLSLIIDEQTPHALPNMDFKIMQGNSLLEQYKGVRLDDIYSNSGQMELAFDEETAARMLLKKHMFDYFEKEDHAEKKKLLKSIDDAVKSMVKAKTFGNTSICTAVDKLDLRNNQEFFLWHTWFSDVLTDKIDAKGKIIKGSGGFDIVIGNPPYIQLQSMKEMSTIYKECNFLTYNKTADIYCLFTEQGFNLLKPKGILCYIMPNKWMQAGYGQQLRSFLSQKQIHNIVDFGDLQIFENATTYTCILLLGNDKAKSTFTASSMNEFNMTLIDKRTNVFNSSDFGKDTWVLSSSKEFSLIKKIKKNFPCLKNFCNGEAYRGILTGLSEAFLINEDTYFKIISEDASAHEVIVPFLLGRDVKPYISPNPIKYLILFKKGFTKDMMKMESPSEVESWNFMQNKYPSICKWLDPFAEKGRARGDKGDFWWELRACDYYEQFDKPKIMYQAFQVKPNFVYDTNACYCNNSMWILPTDNKALLGLFNSKMGWWLISNFCSQIQNGYQLIWKYFCQLPIALKNNNDRISELVEQILSSKKDNPQSDTTALEHEIDLLVYDLYGLTPEEIAIVEGTNK